jgi:hypothetical protein
MFVTSAHENTNNYLSTADIILFDSCSRYAVLMALTSFRWRGPAMPWSAFVIPKNGDLRPKNASQLKIGLG